MVFVLCRLVFGTPSRHYRFILGWLLLPFLYRSCVLDAFSFWASFLNHPSSTAYACLCCFSVPLSYPQDLTCFPRETQTSHLCLGRVATGGCLRLCLNQKSPSSGSTVYMSLPLSTNPSSLFPWCILRKGHLIHASFLLC